LPLISKIQYRNYEPGEFIEDKERSCDETIHLIETFPWEEQRDHLAISLTNPSVTIQTPDNNYLKLAPFYQGKYVLHYFNTRQQLFTRSFQTCQETYPLIRSFFEPGPFDLTGFHRENTWAQHTAVHFITKDFTFRINPQPTLTYACFGLIATIVFIYQFFHTAYVKQPSSSLQLFAWFFSLILTFLWSRLIALFINHYSSAWGKILILSKGKNIFYYGPETRPEPFDKNDIANVITYGAKGRYGRESTHGRLTRVEILFKSGDFLNISCLLMMHDDLINRLAPTVRNFEPNIFPFIPLSSSIPS
jgi:hypothetical protein